MMFDRTMLNQAISYAEYFLVPLGNRWLHVQGVAARAYAISTAFDAEEAMYLMTSAYLHDIGYAPALHTTGFHPLDGAYFVRSLGYDRVASLVAHHSEARFEARIRGLEQALSVFLREQSAVADALTYCDQTIGPTGNIVTPQERRADIIARYGEAHPVTQALHLSEPFIAEAIERTRSRIRLYGLE